MKKYTIYTYQQSIIVILPFIELQLGCTDAEQNIDSIMLICCGVLALSKTIWFRIYANSLINNYRSALNDYMMIENAEQRAIMRRHAFLGRILSCFMVCFSYFNCVVFTLIPLLGDEEDTQINVTNETILEYPIPSTCVLEYLHVPTSMYNILCFIESVVLVLTCTSNHGNILFNNNVIIFVIRRIPEFLNYIFL